MAYLQQRFSAATTKVDTRPISARMSHQLPAAVRESIAGMS